MPTYTGTTGIPSERTQPVEVRSKQSTEAPAVLPPHPHISSLSLV